MPASIKNFSALTGLRKDLKAQQEARALADAEAARQAKIALEEADLFRRSIGQVAPLPSSWRTTVTHSAALATWGISYRCPDASVFSISTNLEESA